MQRIAGVALIVIGAASLYYVYETDLRHVFVESSASGGPMSISWEAYLRFFLAASPLLIGLELVGLRKFVDRFVFK